jgi:putative transposase
MSDAKYDPWKHRRQSLRMKEHDYGGGGRYFITVCTWQRDELFGTVDGGRVHLNECGEAVARQWEALPERFPGITLDAFVMMPNHVHGVLRISPSVEKGVTLGTVLGAFKSLSARELNGLLGRSERPLWQRNYYEGYIRDEASLDQIRTYIRDNPKNWLQDDENPINLRPADGL